MFALRTTLAVLAAIHFARATPAPNAEPDRPSARPASVPFEPRRGGLIVVSARVNRVGPFRLLLDTGSTGSAVSASLATRLKLPDAGTSAVVAIAGQQAGRLVGVRELAVGGFTRQGLTASVLDDGNLAAIGGDLDGILGQDLLGDAAYTLDYRHNRIDWEAAPPDGSAATALKLERREGRWLVMLPQTASRGQIDTSLCLVPDSGATSLVLFESGRPLPVVMQPYGPPIPVATVLGLEQAQRVRVKAIAIGAVLWRDQPAIVIMRRQPNAPVGDGLLPLSAFARVSIDGRAGTLTVYAR